MREIEIKKWIIRVDESKKRDSAILIGLDEDRNEYTLKHYSCDYEVETDIICTEIN